jgi:hypothetical protein
MVLYAPHDAMVKPMPDNGIVGPRGHEIRRQPWEIGWSAVL